MTEGEKAPSLCKPDMVYKINRTHGLHRLRGFRLMPLPGRGNRECPLIQGPQRMKAVGNNPGSPIGAGMTERGGKLFLF